MVDNERILIKLTAGGREAKTLYLVISQIESISTPRDMEYTDDVHCIIRTKSGETWAVRQTTTEVTQQLTAVN